MVYLQINKQTIKNMAEKFVANSNNAKRRR